MAKDKELVMVFDPNTIEHLGIKMYSRIPTAIAELVANAYDADAKKVTVSLYDGEDKRIVVEDDGIGMSFGEINDYFLRIGRNRRIDGERKTASGRVITGRKGLGKLALFGIGDTIEISTIKNGEKVTFQMNWNDLKGTHGRNYKPKIIAREKCKGGKGTIITVSGLKRKSPFNVKAVALSLSKLFNLFDKTFIVYVIKGNVKIGVNSKLRYSGLDTQFEFTFPGYADKMGVDYENKGEIFGIIITTEKPLVPGLRGITLFSNGRLVNAAEFFGLSESSHFYSYVTGWLDVDFVDDWEEDVISTNRQSLNWEFDRTRKLREFLQKTLSEIHKDWRKKRKAKRRKEISEKIDIDVDDWYSKLPTDIKSKIERIVDSVEDSELPADDQKEVVANMHDLVPEYPYYHWRHLHKDIQEASEVEYKEEDYYRAFLEAAKRYINNVKKKSGRDDFKNDQTMMADVFGNNRLLLLVEKYRKRNGDKFGSDTVCNIQNGQHFLSKGVVAGGRNPLSHEELAEVKESGLFTEKDCLDMLSILSHLFKRLDNAVRNRT